MARSHGVLKTTVWDVGSEFRRLTVPAQWAYAMLISQPQINNCGVLPYTPEKWVRLASGLTLDQLAGALAELEQHRFVIVDVETGELLVRTFIKHDKVWSQPKLVTNARKLVNAVESDRIRGYLISRHPWLVERWSRQQIDAHETAENPVENHPPKTPSDTGTHGKGYPSRARPGAGVGAGIGASSTAGPHSNAAVSNQATTNGHGRTPDAAAAEDEPNEELEQLLDDLAVPSSLRERARQEPGRALTCAKYTLEQHGNGGYFRTVFESGDTPTLHADTPRIKPRVRLPYLAGCQAIANQHPDNPAPHIKLWLEGFTDNQDLIQQHIDAITTKEAA